MRRITLILTGLVFLAACSPTAPTTVPLTPTSTSSPYPTSTSSPSQTPTAAPTSTSTSTPSPSQTLNTVPLEISVNMDSLPDGVVGRIGAGRINDIALSPDGHRLAFAGHVGIYIFAVEPFMQGDLMMTTVPIYQVIWSPDGKILAAKTKKEIRFFDYPTGVEVQHWTAESVCDIA
jgi:hypothetical protein